MSIIGIDLGNSNICIAEWQRSTCVTLENDFYYTITPMYLSYKKNNILFGQKAKSDCIRNMNNTIFDIKRINNEEKRYKLPFLESDGSFKIIKDNKKLDKESFYKDLFTKIKEMYFNTNNNINTLVVVLPEYISLKDGDIIKIAAKEANLEIKEFIDEKIPIIHMYQMNNNFNLNETNLIIDIGGSKTGLYLVEIKNYEYTIIDRELDENLGGREFDKKLLEYMIKMFEEEENIKIKGKLERNLELECEKTKISLSSGTSLNLEFNYIYEDEDRLATYEVEREIFENLCNDLFIQFDNLLKNFMKKNNNININQVILIGGTSRMPKIKEIISSIFGEDKLNFTLNPDETIAKGAALYAGMITEGEIEDNFINLRNTIKKHLAELKKRILEEKNIEINKDCICNIDNNKEKNDNNEINPKIEESKKRNKGKESYRYCKTNTFKLTREIFDKKEKEKCCIF